MSWLRQQRIKMSNFDPCQWNITQLTWLTHWQWSTREWARICHGPWSLSKQATTSLWWNTSQVIWCCLTLRNRDHWHYHRRLYQPSSRSYARKGYTSCQRPWHQTFTAALLNGRQQIAQLTVGFAFLPPCSLRFVEQCISKGHNFIKECVRRCTSVKWYWVFLYMHF